MKKSTKLSLTVLITLSLILCLSSCKTVEEKITKMLEEKSAVHTTVCQSVIDGFFESNSVNEILADSISDDSISSINDELSLALSNASSYALNPVGWHMNSVNGYSTNTVVFELIPDNGRLASLSVILEEETSSIVGFSANDVTDFAAKEGTYKLINIGFKAVSLIFIAFAAWMLIDCVKRNVKLKPLWIFVILAGVTVSLSLGNTNLNYNISVGIILELSDFDYSIFEEIIKAKVLLPIGAAVYFFMRKRLPLCDLPREEQTLHVNELLNANNDHE